MTCTDMACSAAQHWGCFNPLRDISAAAYFQGQAEAARKAFLNQSFDLEHVPKDRLLFFSGKRPRAQGLGSAAGTITNQKPTS